MPGTGKGLSGGAADLLGGSDADAAGGAVGIAGIDGDYADASSAALEMAATDGDGRGLHAVGGEHRGGGGGLVGDHDGEIGFSAGLDARFHGREAKAARQCVIRNQRRCAHGQTAFYCINPHF